MQILTSEHLSSGDAAHIAENLSTVSFAEPAMLGRPPGFYMAAFETNRLVVAVEDEVTRIVGSGLLLPLADGWAEISGVFVRRDARGRGIGNHIVRGVQELARIHGLQLLLTMKPSVPGSEGMIVEAAKNQMVPVSFDHLRQFPEAFRSCCVCHDDQGSPNCPDRDVSCVLGVGSASPGARESTLRFVRSATFEQAVPDSVLRTKILHLSPS